jgi:hypothetical protein
LEGGRRQGWIEEENGILGERGTGELRVSKKWRGSREKEEYLWRLDRSKYKFCERGEGDDDGEG